MQDFLAACILADTGCLYTPAKADMGSYADPAIADKGLPGNFGHIRQRFPRQFQATGNALFMRFLAQQTPTNPFPPEREDSQFPQIFYLGIASETCSYLQH